MAKRAKYRKIKNVHHASNGATQAVSYVTEKLGPDNLWYRVKPRKRKKGKVI